MATLTAWHLRSASLLILLLGTAVLSQESPRALPEVLYTLTQFGDVTRYEEKSNIFLVTEELELAQEDDTPRSDTIVIKKRIDSNTFIVGRPNLERVAVMRRTEIVKDSVYFFGPLFEGESEEVVLEKFQNEPTPAYASLFSKILFTREKLLDLKDAPGLDRITRSDLLASLQWREGIGEAIQSYMVDNPEAQFYRLRRMVDNYRNQKLVLLGYNPYKQVEYNWEKQFAGDDEVLQRLTEPISFD